MTMSWRARRFRIGLLLMLLGAAAPFTSQPLFAQGGRHALLIQGASGEEQYAKQHRAWLDALATTLRDGMGYEAAAVTVVAERPGNGEMRATAENVRAAVGRLAKSLTASDQLLIVFIGHGTAQGQDAKFNLIGPDLSVAEWNVLLEPIRASLAVVHTTSGSFPYLAGLAAPGRVVVTATSSFAQQFHTVFPDAFVRALSDPEADQDKNSRISIHEAFTHASRLVREHYERTGTMATETAVIDDTGDGKGRLATAEAPTNSAAALWYLDAPRVATSADPELQKLLTRQQALTDQVDELRRRRASMSEEEYTRQFEALLAELAEVSRDVRRRSDN